VGLSRFTHPRALQTLGNEEGWWTERGIDARAEAQRLWCQSHGIRSPAKRRSVAGISSMSPNARRDRARSWRGERTRARDQHRGTRGPAMTSFLQIKPIAATLGSARAAHRARPRDRQPQCPEARPHHRARDLVRRTASPARTGYLPWEAITGTPLCRPTMPTLEASGHSHDKDIICQNT
jgi:hypothetical protein